jgi:hypothetical protein
MNMYDLDAPRILGVRISKMDGGIDLSFRHTGEFRLDDYEEVHIDVKSVRLIKRG